MLSNVLYYVQYEKKIRKIPTIYEYITLEQEISSVE